VHGDAHNEGGLERLERALEEVSQPRNDTSHARAYCRLLFLPAQFFEKEYLGPHNKPFDYVVRWS
jgi:hypothetical protein